MRHSLPFALLLAAACNTAPPANNSRTAFHQSPSAALAALPFSEAVAAGGFLFVAGQVGTADGSLTLVPGGIAAEAKQALGNMQAILARHGASLQDVVKVTVFLADIAEWPAFNTVYKQVFASPYPARSALGANGLALGARVEVECIARLPASGN
jgi:reactive intermediate/imine deaminase